MAYTISERCGKQASADKSGNATYTRKFRVVFDDYVNDGNYVASLPEIPAPFSPYPTDFLSLVEKISPTQSDDDPSVWDVAIEYSRLMRDQEQVKPNPIDRRIKCVWDTNPYEKPFTYDINGHMVTNSAGEPFVPPEQIEDSRISVTCTGNQYFVPDWIFSFRNVINQNGFTLEGIYIPERCARVARVHVSEWQVENGIYYRTVGITLELREQRTLTNASYGVGSSPSIGSTCTTSASYQIAGWDKAIQDAGYQQISSSKLVKITDGNGMDVSQPQLLNGKGVALTKPISSGDEYYRVYDGFIAKDFGPLNLPS